MTTTTNLKLNKPNADDFYNINVQNENMDIIDEKVAEHTGNKNNPHNVTAEQIGAIEKYSSCPLLTDNDANKTMVFGSYRVATSADKNLPSEWYGGVGSYGIVLVLPWNTGTIGQMAVKLGSSDSSGIWIRSTVIANKEEWYEWKRMLDSNGGTITGDLVIETNKTPTVKCTDTSVNRSAQIRLDSYWGATTLVTESDAYNWSGLYIHPEKDGERIDLNSAIQLFRCVAGTTSSYNIFGGHNKPAGAYTGDGNTTVRTVDTKGISNVCVVWSGNGFVLATPKGGLYCSGNGIIFIPPTEYTFVDGVFTITSNNVGINNSDTKYYYQVL